MEEIKISTLTPKVLSRLADGLPIRIKDGKDSTLVIDKSSLRKMKNAFIKGKGITKSFSPAEIEANAKMEGKGIFGKRFDKFLKRLGKKTGFNVKKAVYAVGDVIKPFAKQAVKGGLDAAAAVADPYLGNVGVAKSIADGVSKKADQFLDKPSDFGVGSGLYASGSGFYSAEGTYHPNNVVTHRHNVNKHRDLHNSLGGSGLYAQTKIRGGGKSLLDQAFTPREAIKFFKKDVPDAIRGKSLGGSGLYAQTKIRGGGKSLLDQAFTPREAIKFFKKDVPDAIRGKSLGGSGLYAQTKIRGGGKSLLDQAFTPREAIKFFKKDVPDAIRGKSLGGSGLYAQSKGQGLATSKLTVIVMMMLGKPPMTNFHKMMGKDKKKFNEMLNAYIKNLPPEGWLEKVNDEYNQICTDEVFNEEFDPRKYEPMDINTEIQLLE